MNPYAVASLPFREPKYALALCREFDPEVFFPHRGGSNLQAKLICSFCTHTDQCRTDARERGEQFGVFGGEDADERRHFMRTGVEAKRYSPVSDLREMGLSVNQIAQRLNIQHDSVTRNLNRKKVSA